MDRALMGGRPVREEAKAVTHGRGRSSRFSAEEEHA